jgi:hypothetical protein
MLELALLEGRSARQKREHFLDEPLGLRYRFSEDYGAGSRISKAPGDSALAARRS